MSRWKEILHMAWPLIIANSFWNLQLTIDRVFLGSYSTEALAAAMAVMGVFWVPMALLQQTAGYVTTFVAQYYGAVEYKLVGRSVWQSIYVSVLGGFAFLLLIWASPSFFALVGHSELVQKYEIEYFNAICFSALPTALVAAISGFFTGLGQMKVITQINFVGLLLNVLLDYLLIFGNWGFPALGVTGAGYATALATCGSCIYGLLLLFSRENEKRFSIRSNFHIDLSLLRRFLKFGLPSGLQWALEGLAFTVFLIIMGRLPQGEAALASSSIAVTVMMLSVLPSMGVSQAVLTLVGQCMGEKNPSKAEGITWDGVKIVSVYMGVVGLSFVAMPHFYLSWFENQNNPELWAQVTAMAPTLLKIVALFSLLDSVYLNISFALKGAGDTRFVSLVALLLPWPLMVGPAYLIREWEGALYWSWGFAVVYATVITLTLYVRFKQGQWKSMSVIHG